MNNKSDKPITFLPILFWLLWIISLLIIPIYGFTLLFKLSAVKSDNPLSYLSPVIGVIVFIAQSLILARSFQQARQTGL